MNIQFPFVRVKPATFEDRFHFNACNYPLCLYNFLFLRVECLHPHAQFPSLPAQLSAESRSLPEGRLPVQELAERGGPSDVWRIQQLRRRVGRERWPLQSLEDAHRWHCGSVSFCCRRCRCYRCRHRREMSEAPGQFHCRKCCLMSLCWLVLGGGGGGVFGIFCLVCCCCCCCCPLKLPH